MLHFTRKPKIDPKPTESPSAMIKRVEAEIKAAELLAQHNDRMRVLHETIAVQRAEVLSADAITVKTERQARNEELRDRLINYGPLVVISGLAIIGQYGSFGKILRPVFGSFAGNVVGAFCAVALEMIALFLGLHALKALRRKDSAAGLLFAATAVAGLVAYMNYSHFSANHIVGWTFALFSFVAPFLWRIKIKSDHRDELVANGEIDKRGLRLERSRLLWHPIKSLGVMRYAAWTGERDRDLAVKEWEATRDEKRADKASKKIAPEDLDMLHAMIEDLKIDLAGTDEPVAPMITRTSNRPAITANGSNGYRTDHPKWNEGVALFEASFDSGNPLKQQELANELGMSNRVLAGQIQRYVTERNGKRHDHDGSDLAAEAD